MASITETGIYLHITYQGKIYYLSDSARTTTITYFPFLANSPSISFGGDGFARVKSGSISILRYVEDENDLHINDHPFAGNRYLDVLTSVQEIPFELYLDNIYLPLFKGSLTLESVTENTLEFSVLDEEFTENLVYPVLDKERELINDLLFQRVGDQYRVLIHKNDNSFSNNDIIIFEEKNPSSNFESDEIKYQILKDNRYIVTDRTIFYFNILDYDNPTRYITNESLLIDEANLSLYSSHGFSEITDEIYRVSSSIAQEYFVGSIQYNPFTFGQIEIKSPVIHAGSTDYGNSQNFYLIRNPSLDPTNINIYDDGIDITANIDQANSDNNYIALTQTPVGEIGITGTSVNGNSLEEFYRMVCLYLNGTYLGRTTDEADMPDLDDEPDFTLAPDIANQTIPIYKDSETSVIELASEVAEATNYTFFFRIYRTDSGYLGRKLVLVDLNRAFEDNSLHDSTYSPLLGGITILQELDESVQIKIDLNYPFPIKAIESTITVNRLYQASQEAVRDQSIMKPQDLTFRVDIHKIGNTEKRDVFANTISEGVFWLKRKAETGILPSVTVNLKELRYELEIGNKLRVFDELRQVMIDMLISEIGYDFQARKTMIKGIGSVSKIERY